MYKKIVKIASVLFCSSLLLCSCGQSKTIIPDISTAAPTTTVATTTANPYAANPLTGETTLSKSAVGKRPVAIMINNIIRAQNVQTGVGDADMVFETMVEGGITRLMAVYSDISVVKQIGTVRSARYSYAQLACGLDARYVHCGADNKYCTPLMNELCLDHLDLGNNASSAAKRISNGLAYEHTLYTYGDKLYKIHKSGRTEIKDRAKNVYSFNKKAVKFDTAATDLKINFSDYYKTTFKYDSNSNKYLRGDSDGDTFKDYVTGNGEAFSNVIVMYTDITYFDDNHHMKSHLDSGSGVYISNGTQTKINWEKGNSSDPLKFFDESGKDFKLNTGNSYICITDSKNKSSSTIA